MGILTIACAPTPTYWRVKMTDKKRGGILETAYEEYDTPEEAAEGYLGLIIIMAVLVAVLAMCA